MSAGHLFATAATSDLLVAVAGSTENEHLRVSACVALSNLARLNGALFYRVLEKMGLKPFAGMLMDSNARIQQPFLTMLNMAILNSSSEGGKVAALLLVNNEILVPCLSPLLEHR